MGKSLLVEYFEELPAARDDGAVASAVRYREALETFRQRVAARYTEGTLQRLLSNGAARARRAAVLALGLTGTMHSNAALAALLHDDDRTVRRLAVDALWSVWFRAASEANTQELQRLLTVRDAAKKRAGLDALVRKAADFAEAYNQRAILHFQAGAFDLAAADCERVLRLNPHHFGAQAGLAQCHLKLGRPEQALQAFRAAYQINPTDELLKAIRTLEA